ncbi:Nse1 non-SMC component of SMC5-6 complex-domain-containing protein [Diaporthe sp. PMI_573]|nr:Nse1 non-SMC component of SMC5-6 complex-domain-containing protein [Diaporthaceae sp. PMI_573]
MVEWEPVLPIGWDHRNRAFLQALTGRGFITLGEGKSIIAAILSAEDDSARRITSDSINDNTFRQYISKAREAVASLDYDIRNSYHQISREQIWALINAHSDPSTQMATSRTPDEISFIKRVLDAMFETYNTPRQEVMAVTAAQARKVARPAAPVQDGDADREEPAQRTADRALKHSEIERLLPSLVAEGWFEESDEGFYSLSPRSLMELKTWLVAAYNDPDVGPDSWQRIKFCEACKEIVTIGQRCPGRDCNTRIHDICTEAYWRTRRGGRTCPRCETEWTGKNYVGERAVTETAAAHRQVGRNRRSNGNASMVNYEADEEVDNEDDGGE